MELNMECTNKLLLKINGRKQIVPCGKCIGCRIHRTTEWTTRLLFELKDWNYKAVFLTLTYDDLHLPIDYGLHKEDVQSFWKMLRKDLALEKRKIKYYMCGEYGDTYGRPHYHAIVFGLDSTSEHDRQLVKDNWRKCDERRFNGSTRGFASVTADSINYVTGYIQKKLNGPKAEVYGDRLPPFSLQSKGLGLNYFLENQEDIVKDMCVYRNGVKLSVPRYYVKKFGLKTDTTATLLQRAEFLEKEKGYDIKENMILSNSKGSEFINLAYWQETMTSSAVYGKWLEQKFNME